MAPSNDTVAKIDDLATSGSLNKKLFVSSFDMILTGAVAAASSKRGFTATWSRALAISKVTPMKMRVDMRPAGTYREKVKSLSSSHVT